MYWYSPAHLYSWFTVCLRRLFKNTSIGDHDEINEAGVGGSITGGVTSDDGGTLFSNGSFSAGEVIKSS